MDKDGTKKFLITGGNGFIGSYLVHQLLQQRQKVIIIDNLSNSNIKSNQTGFEIYSPNNINNSISFYEADIQDKSLIDTIFEENPNIHTCIHLAAKISVSDSIKNPIDTMNVNVNGTYNMLVASANNDIKNFVFASSAAVYGNSTNVPLKETENCDPISPYGISKLRGEEMVSQFSKNIYNTISLRFFNIYGIGQSIEYSGVITKFAESLASGKPIEIYGNGHQLRDFINIKDVIRAIIIASSDNYNKEINSHSNNLHNIFNVATGKPTKIIDIANMMMKLFNKINQKIIYKDLIEGDILQSYADIKKTEKKLGFKYTYDIENGLDDTYKNLLS